MLASQTIYLVVVGVNDYLFPNMAWSIATYVVAAFIMFTYSLMYFGISNSVKRAFKAQSKQRKYSEK
jgi:predicted membrane channel-forming protein YqfA (hemolysin III family)